MKEGNPPRGSPLFDLPKAKRTTREAGDESLVPIGSERHGAQGRVISPCPPLGGSRGTGTRAFFGVGGRSEGLTRASTSGPAAL